MVLATVREFLSPPPQAMAAPIAKGGMSSGIVLFFIIRGRVRWSPVYNWVCELFCFWIQALPIGTSRSSFRSINLSRFSTNLGRLRNIRETTSSIVVIPKPARASRRTRRNIIRKKRCIIRLIKIGFRSYRLCLNGGTGRPIT